MLEQFKALNAGLLLAAAAPQTFCTSIALSVGVLEMLNPPKADREHN